MLYAYTVYSAALTPVVLAAFYSKRVTAWGAVSAIGAGTVVTLAWGTQPIQAVLPPILAARDAIFPALAAAVLAMVVVSLFTPKPKPEQLAQFAD
jgi:SSS family solute:Na+ symporter/sodium/proline symporter